MHKSLHTKRGIAFQKNLDKGRELIFGVQINKIEKEKQVREHENFNVQIVLSENKKGIEQVFRPTQKIFIVFIF